MAAEADLRARPVLPRPQDPAVLPALRHRPQQPRGGAGLQGRQGPVALRDAPGPGRRRPARRPRVPRLDDDPVDAGLQRGAGRPPRARLRGGGARRPPADPGPRPRGAPVRLGRRHPRRDRRVGARRPALHAPVRLGRPARVRDGRAGGQRLAGGPRHLRHGGRRLGHRAHVARLRGGRLRGGAAVQPPRGPAGGRPRRLPGRPAARRRHLREGRGHGPADRHEEAGAGLPFIEGRAQLSALLAVQQPAAVHGARQLVHPHHPGARRAAGQQRRHPLVPARGGRRPLRRVAREQRGLGHQPQPLLGHAAARLGVRAEPPSTCASSARSPSCASWRRVWPTTSTRTARSSTTSRFPAPAKGARGRCGARPR